MAEQDDNGGLRLRVDRLAAAMDAARARARAPDGQAGSQDAPAAGARPDTDARSDTGVTVPGAPGERPVAASGADRPSVSAAAPVSPPARNRAAEASASRVGQSATPSVDQASPGAVTAGIGRNAAERAAGEPTLGPTGYRAPDMARPDVAGRPETAGGGPSRPLLLTPAFHPQPGNPGEPGPDAPRYDQRRSEAAAAIDPADGAGMGDAPAPVPAARDVAPGVGTAPTVIVPAAVMPPPLRDPVRAAVLLSLTGVSAEIGRHRVLQDVAFAVPKGAVTLLLGRKGAGKTTVLRTVMGLLRPRAGRITLDGTRIELLSPQWIARAGVSYVPQSMRLFTDLTVAENIAIGSRSGPVMRERLDWLTGLFPLLATRWRSPAGDLPPGAQRMLALARALVAKRNLYLIDDPTLGLAEAEAETVIAALRDLRLQGATILLVTPDVALARALGDGCVALERGRIGWTGTISDIADEDLLRACAAGLRPGDAAA